MELGSEIWNTFDSSAKLRPIQDDERISASATKEYIKAAKNVERRANLVTAGIQAERHKACSALSRPSNNEMRQWLADRKAETVQTETSQTQRLYTSKQIEVAAKIVERVCQESMEGGETTLPLLWCVHGGPGVGKSHTLKLVKEFFTYIGYRSDVEYVLTALQAVMADQLGGDTLHHALGVTPCKFQKTKGGDSDSVTKRAQEISRFLEQCRWLVIDEVSMISAQLLAEIDQKLRRITRDIETTKKHPNLLERPFGGLNVIFCGDFWQLDPPSGTPIASIPAELVREARQYAPAPDVLEGHTLFWGKALDDQNCVQGITELTECMRCDDEWLRAVQEEMRAGDMSADTHSFLHGRTTTVPGSHIPGAAAWNKDCTAECKEMFTEARSMTTQARGRHILAHECGACRRERRSKQLVATGAGDVRFTQTRFREAKSIFPNNAVKYDVNKRRAQEYAMTSGEGIVWARARDKPCQRVLQGRVHVERDKRRWLTWHDKDCGDLYGMLPLSKGMPVTLQDHISRDPEYLLLRGKVGKIHSWIEHENEHGVCQNGVKTLSHVPQVVFVKYDDVTWTLPGMDERGLYPIRPWERTWYIDRNRKKPVLAVKRYQVPLAPAYAMTAHAAQGQTLDAAIVDLQQGVGVSTIASYVAFTRVRKRSDLIIYRPFDRSLFNKGRLTGPTTLLRVLRGEDVDWDGIQGGMMPRKRCAGCGGRQEKKEFASAEWKDAADGWCKTCTKQKTEAGTPLRCSRCHIWYSETEYNKRSLSFGRQRFCKGCIGCEVRPCRKCLRTLTEACFARAWDEDDATRECLPCSTDMRRRKCLKCEAWRPIHAFAQGQLQRKGGRHMCEACMRSHHHCEVCGQMYASLKVEQIQTATGVYRICGTCNKCRCANSECNRILTARERIGRDGDVRTSNISSGHTRIYCERCGDTCSICEIRTATGDLRARATTAGVQQVCPRCAECVCSAAVCTNTLTIQERGDVRRDDVARGHTQIRCTSCAKAPTDAAAAEARVEKECRACKRLLQITSNDATERRNLRRCSSWVCPECSVRGYTCKNTRTYKCDKDGCPTEGGHKLFTGQDIWNRERGTLEELSCNECKEAKRRRKH